MANFCPAKPKIKKDRVSRWTLAVVFPSFSYMMVANNGREDTGGGQYWLGGHGWWAKQIEN